MKVLVSGGREYLDKARMAEVLSAFKPTEIIHGGCRGADRLADEWAKRNFIAVREFKADWGKYGPSAGPIRNERMLAEAEPDIVLIFPGGKGTLNMAILARTSGIRTIIIEEKANGR